MKRAERFGFAAVEHVAAVSANGYQADVFEDAEVLGDARLFEAERGDYVAHGALLQGQKREDSSAARFCDSVEGVGGGGSARHGMNIYPYRNMSRGILREGLCYLTMGRRTRIKRQSPRISRSERQRSSLRKPTVPRSRTARKNSACFVPNDELHAGVANAQALLVPANGRAGGWIVLRFCPAGRTAPGARRASPPPT